jgi:nucleolar protein 56
MEVAKRSVSNAYATEEHSVIQAINAYLELERIKNQVYERLEEWYSIYFPELKISNQSTYAKFVIEIGKNKKAASIEKLREVVGDKAEDTMKGIAYSIGREPSESEYATIRRLAETELSLIEAEQNVDSYLEGSTKKLMPNITYLIDYKVAAELLAKAGSLSRMATLPAGTIQLLGAEKALFKHIKFGGKPPKYGVLFKLPVVSNAPKNRGGKIARMYATKISIASKADAFTKRFIADKLKETLDKAISRSASQPRRTDAARPANPYRKWKR